MREKPASDGYGGKYFGEPHNDGIRLAIIRERRAQIQYGKADLLENNWGFTRHSQLPPDIVLAGQG